MRRKQKKLRPRECQTYHKMMWDIDRDVISSSVANDSLF